MPSAAQPPPPLLRTLQRLPRLQQLCQICAVTVSNDHPCNLFWRLGVQVTAHHVMAGILVWVGFFHGCLFCGECCVQKAGICQSTGAAYAAMGSTASSTFYLGVAHFTIFEVEALFGPILIKLSEKAFWPLTALSPEWKVSTLACRNGFGTSFKQWSTACRCVLKTLACRKMPLNIRIQWNAGTASVSECVLKTLACRGLRVGPSKAERNSGRR